MIKSRFISVIFILWNHLWYRPQKCSICLVILMTAQKYWQHKSFIIILILIIILVIIIIIIIIITEKTSREKKTDASNNWRQGRNNVNDYDWVFYPENWVSFLLLIAVKSLRVSSPWLQHTKVQLFSSNFIYKVASDIFFLKPTAKLLKLAFSYPNWIFILKMNFANLKCFCIRNLNSWPHESFHFFSFS